MEIKMANSDRQQRIISFWVTEYINSVKSLPRSHDLKKAIMLELGISKDKDFEDYIDKSRLPFRTRLRRYGINQIKEVAEFSRKRPFVLLGLGVPIIGGTAMAYMNYVSSTGSITSTTATGAAFDVAAFTTGAVAGVAVAITTKMTAKMAVNAARRVAMHRASVTKNLKSRSNLINFAYGKNAKIALNESKRFEDHHTSKYDKHGVDIKKIENLNPVMVHTQATKGLNTKVKEFAESRTSAEKAMKITIAAASSPILAPAYVYSRQVAKSESEKIIKGIKKHPENTLGYLEKSIRLRNNHLSKEIFNSLSQDKKKEFLERIEKMAIPKKDRIKKLNIGKSLSLAALKERIPNRIQEKPTNRVVFKDKIQEKKVSKKLVKDIENFNLYSKAYNDNKILKRKIMLKYASSEEKKLALAIGESYQASKQKLEASFEKDKSIEPKLKEKLLKNMHEFEKNKTDKLLTVSLNKHLNTLVTNKSTSVKRTSTTKSKGIKV
jgi:hypothetical protein